ncbi:MAG: S49 family peptidase [Chlamydiia bacterium]
MNFIRESIFASALRAFSSAFLGIIGGLLGFGFFITLFTIAFFPAKDTPPPKYMLVNQPRADGTLSAKMHEPTILRINVDSMIGGPTVNADLFDSLLLQIDQQIPHDQLKAILIYFDTPGGSAVDSYRIFSALKTVKARYKIPVYGYVEGLCASGGIYISAACDKMFSSPPSILGSVGVRMGPFFNVYDLLKTHGVDAANISTKNKIHMDPFTPWKPDEQDYFKPIMDELYTQFVGDVVDGRCPEGMTKEDYKAKLLDIGANVYTSKDAVQYGYTNEPNASLSSTIEALALAAGITDQNYRVLSAMYMPPFQLGGVQSFFKTGKITVDHRLNGDETPTLKNDHILMLYR